MKIEIETKRIILERGITVKEFFNYMSVINNSNLDDYVIEVEKSSDYLLTEMMNYIHRKELEEDNPTKPIDCISDRKINPIPYPTPPPLYKFKNSIKI
jgi:hypothetical protein